MVGGEVWLLPSDLEHHEISLLPSEFEKGNSRGEKRETMLDWRKSRSEYEIVAYLESLVYKLELANWTTAGDGGG